MVIALFFLLHSPLSIEFKMFDDSIILIFAITFVCSLMGYNDDYDNTAKMLQKNFLKFMNII